MAHDAHPLTGAQARAYSAPTDRALDASPGGEAVVRRIPRSYAFCALALACAAAALFANHVLAPRLLERIPDGWSWQSGFVGHAREPDAKGTGFAPRVAALYKRQMRVDGAGPVPGTVRIVDDYTMHDVKTGKVIWRYTVYPIADRRTGAHADPKYADEILVFPPNVERKVYVLRQNYVEGYPMRFVEEETIDRMTTYLFEYVGTIEYTASYRGTPDYPGVAVTPGQEIKCADDVFYLRIWVEPLTGTTVKVAEGCEAGDYVFDIKTGERVKPVLVWSGDTEGKDVMANIERARAMRLRFLTGNYLAPALAGLALVFGAAMLLSLRRAA